MADWSAVLRNVIIYMLVSLSAMAATADSFNECVERETKSCVIYSDPRLERKCRAARIKKCYEQHKPKALNSACMADWVPLCAKDAQCLLVITQDCSI